MRQLTFKEQLQAAQELGLELPKVTGRSFIDTRGCHHHKSCQEELTEVEGISLAQAAEEEFCSICLMKVRRGGRDAIDLLKTVLAVLGMRKKALRLLKKETVTLNDLQHISNLEKGSLTNDHPALGQWAARMREEARQHRYQAAQMHRETLLSVIEKGVKAWVREEYPIEAEFFDMEKLEKDPRKILTIVPLRIEITPYNAQEWVAWRLYRGDHETLIELPMFYLPVVKDLEMVTETPLDESEMETLKALIKDGGLYSSIQAAYQAAKQL